MRASRRRAITDMRKRAKGRRCGDCSVCCTVVAVASLNKPAGRPCGHLCGDGCSLFGDERRPPECSKWDCAWLLGFEGIERPDQSGIIVWGNRGGIVVDECWPGATQPEDIVRMSMAATAGNIKFAVRWNGYA